MLLYPVLGVISLGAAIYLGREFVRRLREERRERRGSERAPAADRPPAGISVAPTGAFVRALFTPQASRVCGVCDGWAPFQLCLQQPTPSGEAPHLASPVLRMFFCDEHRAAVAYELNEAGRRSGIFS